VARLSDNFTLEEMVLSQAATRGNLANRPGPREIENLRLLCEKILQRIRDDVGPIVVSSGYRSAAVNAAVGGSPTSQHVEGKAADITYPRVGTKALFKRIIELGLPFDQLIFEGTCVHVSFDEARTRGQIMRATFANGRATYTRLSKRDALAL